MPTATSYLLKANKLVARIMGRMGVAMLPNVAVKNGGIEHLNHFAVGSVASVQKQ
ncbi:hypothetical protein [Roseinatronobacter sp.]|uniref:hypothetical protein n=1 Tax=Roseinatronobacter sp. TaxID=1945755 RepID=UPI0025F3E99B|nr:hypothetical protein [Rhodobaca sp.]